MRNSLLDGGCNQGKARGDAIGDNEDRICTVVAEKETVVGDSVRLDCVKVMMVAKSEGEDALRCGQRIHEGDAALSRKSKGAETAKGCSNTTCAEKMKSGCTDDAVCMKLTVVAGAPASEVSRHSFRESEGGFPPENSLTCEP